MKRVFVTLAIAIILCFSLARYGCAATEPVCDLEHLDLCATQSTCEGVGGYWYEDACNNEPESFVCPLIGNTYRFDMPDISYSVSNFRCQVGPGCRGTCDLMYGNFDTGPMYIRPLFFDCLASGITIAGLPCDFRGENLRCLGVNITNCYRYFIGNVIYCFQEEKAVVIFEAQ